jgi:hypothetical protein
VIGFGLGLAMATAMATATLGVRPDDAGVASATVNTSSRSAGRSAPLGVSVKCSR